MKSFIRSSAFPQSDLGNPTVQPAAAEGVVEEEPYVSFFVDVWLDLSVVETVNDPADFFEETYTIDK